MPEREALHRLVDTLPESQLREVEGILTSYQSSPPRHRMDFARLRERAEKIRREMQQRLQEHASGRGMIGGSGGGGRMSSSGAGHHSISGWEGDTFVIMTLRSFLGYELEITDRFRLAEDKRRLLYRQEIAGPDGARHEREVEFTVSESAA